MEFGESMDNQKIAGFPPSAYGFELFWGVLGWSRPVKLLSSARFLGWVPFLYE